MRKFIYLLATIITFNISFITPSFSISGGIFKNILNIFKSGGDDVIKNGEDVVRGIKNSTENIKLGPIEFRLLSTFLEKPGKVWSRDALLDRVWGRDIYVDTRTVDVHIGRLRRALCKNGAQDLVRTVRGAGYALG